MGVDIFDVFEERHSGAWYKLDVPEEYEPGELSELGSQYNSYDVLGYFYNRHEIKEVFFESKGYPKDLSEGTFEEEFYGGDGLGCANWLTLSDLRTLDWSQTITLYAELGGETIIQIEVDGVLTDVAQIPLSEFASDLYYTYKSMEEYAEKNNIAPDDLRVVYAFD